MIVCGSFGRKAPVCRVCGAPAPYLCDGPVGNRTCDAPICEAHRTNVGPDRDLCPLCVLRRGDGGSAD